MTCHAQFPLGEFGILTSQPSASWYSFGFDGRFVVWADNRSGGNGQVYAYDLNFQTEALVHSQPSGAQSQCRVCGGIVVWFYQPPPISLYRNELWAKDLTGSIWAAGEARMLAQLDGPGGLDINGDWVAWGQGNMWGVGGDIFALNLRTGEQVAINGSATDQNPVVSGSNVYYMTTPGHVWGWGGPARDWDVYRFDLTTRVNLPVKVGSGHFQPISADGNYVLLEEVPDYNPWPPRRLWLKDIVTDQETVICESTTPLGSVSGNKLVYSQVPGPLYAYDIATEERSLISPIAVAGWLPELRNNIAVWADQRSPASAGNWFIHGYRFANTDATPPTPNCPGDITINTELGKCEATVFWTATVTDNSPGATIECVPPSGSGFPKGTTMVTCTATDAAGNTASCSFPVTVQDLEPPSIVCPADILLPCSVDLLEFASYSASAQDNCTAQPTVTFSRPSGSGFPVGVTMVTATATDEAGNTSPPCTFKLTREALGFGGFLSPIGGADASGGSFASPVRTFKLGSTIPVKFTASCGGTPVTTGVHHLQAVKYSDATTGADPIDASPQDAATTGNQFRLTDDGQWHFNLDTRATGMTKGIWQLIATLSDGSQHRVWIQLK